MLQFCFRTVRRQELSSYGSEHVKLPWHTDICCVQNPPCPVRPTPRCPLTVSHISITASCTPSPWFTARPSCRRPRHNHVYNFGIRYKYSSCTTDFNTDWILWNITSKQQKCLQFCLHLSTQALGLWWHAPSIAVRPPLLLSFIHDFTYLYTM